MMPVEEEGIQTFMSCEFRKEVSFPVDVCECRYGIEYPEVPAWACEYLIGAKRCPKGFQ